MKFLAILSALSVVCLINGQLEPPPTDPGCNDTATSIVHGAIFAAVNSARTISPILDHQNPLRLVFELSFIASWQIETANWNDGGCPNFPNYSFTRERPSDECCPPTADCTQFLLFKGGLITPSKFYVGAFESPTPITMFNAAEMIPNLLQNEPFSFLLGVAPDGTTPSPTDPPAVSDKLGIGLSCDGRRLVLIMGIEDSFITYTDCAEAPPVPITTTSTIATSPISTTPVSTTAGNGTTDVPPNTISTISTISTTLENAANNLGVGYVALGVVGMAYLNL